MTDSKSPLQVWDLPTRAFHWSFAALIAVCFLSEPGGRLHNIAGYLVLGLVAFRLWWGSAGSRYARFSDFLVSPSALFAYLGQILSGRAPRFLGHNPAGGWWIIVLLAGALGAAGSGWLSISDRYWGNDMIEALHESVSWGLLAAVAVHLAGVLLSSLIHHENLPMAMISGKKRPE